MSGINCGGCQFLGDRHFGEYDFALSNAPVLFQCRRHAPTVLQVGHSSTRQAWPLVRASDWCGDFVAKPPAPPHENGELVRMYREQGAAMQEMSK